MRRQALIAVLFCLALAPGAAGDPGTEFWAVLATDWPTLPGPNSFCCDLTVVVGNPSTTIADVRVATEVGEIDSAQVPPGESALLELGQAREVRGSALTRRAYRITSDVPVHAYQVVAFDMSKATPAASVLMDRSGFGSEYMALSLTADIVPDRPSVVTVVSPGSVRVEIIPADDIQAGDGVPAMSAGVPVFFDLEPFDVLHLASVASGDLTGTIVRADGPVEVFSGCETCVIDDSAADIVQELMLPLPLWGTTAVAVTSTPLTEDINKWRILAAEDGTRVTTEPRQPGTPATIDAGRWIEFNGNDDFLVTADRPVLVGRYNTEGLGMFFTTDPSLTLMLPPDRFATGAVFALPTGNPRGEVNWVDLVAPPGASITVDGTPLAPSELAPIGTTGWNKAQIQLGDATLTHSVISDVPIGIYVGAYSGSGAMTFPGAIGLPPPPECDLRTASLADLTPPLDKAGDLFGDATSCSPDRLPADLLIPAFSTAPPSDVDPVAGSALSVYEVACPCAGTLYLTRSGAQVRAEWAAR